MWVRTLDGLVITYHGIHDTNVENRFALNR